MHNPTEIPLVYPYPTLDPELVLAFFVDRDDETGENIPGLELDGDQAREVFAPMRAFLIEKIPGLALHETLDEQVDHLLATVRPDSPASAMLGMAMVMDYVWEFTAEASWCPRHERAELDYLGQLSTGTPILSVADDDVTVRCPASVE